LVFCLVVGAWIFAGYIAVESVDAISQNGLKSVIENIWCGPEKNCL